MWWLLKRRAAQQADVPVLPVTRTANRPSGWRRWLVGKDKQGDWGLYSMRGHLWPTASLDAECLPWEKSLWQESLMRPSWVNPALKMHEEPAPLVQCRCGIYATLVEDDGSRWDHFVKGRLSVGGNVALSGTVIRSEYGWRGGHADIVSPVIISADCCSEDRVLKDDDEMQPGSPFPYVSIPCDRSAVWLNERFYGYCENHQPKTLPAEGAPARPFIAMVAAALEHRYGLTVLTGWPDMED